MSNSSAHANWSFVAKHMCHSPAFRILEAHIIGLLNYILILKIFTVLSQNKFLIIFDGKIEALTNFSLTLQNAERFLVFGWGVWNQIKEHFSVS